MTMMPCKITLDVDLGNPGQFLACCGLLELASRLDAGAVGCFGERSFSLSTGTDALLKALSECEISARSLEDDEFIARQPAKSAPKSSKTLNPVCFGDPFRLEVDWWLKPSPLRELKIWAGDAMVPARIAAALQKCLQTSMKKCPDMPLQQRLAELSTVEVSPFHFAGTKSRHALDVGFSVDKLKGYKLAHQPLVELLVFIALQRFRPRSVGDQLQLAAWATPLPVAAGAAVAGGGIDSLTIATITFRVVDRDDKGHKQLSLANKEIP